MHRAILLLLPAFALFGASDHQPGLPARPSISFQVIALDSNSQPVTDLRRSEVRIVDNGVNLRADSLTPLTGASAERPLAPNEFTNRPSSKDSATLVLLDLLNANLAERGLGWHDVAVRLARAQAGGRVFVYLLTKEGAFYPIIGFGRLPLDVGEASVAGIERRLSDAMNAVNRLRPQDFQVDAELRTRTTYKQLQGLLGDFADMPGRKSFVWVSHGVPINARSIPRGALTDYTPVVQDFAGELNRAAIALYPVDMEDRQTNGMESEDTLRLLADLTSGKWFGEDFGAAMAQIDTDARSRYLLRYTPGPSNWDGKFHKLRIICDRKGVQLRAATGYLAAYEPVSPRGRLALAALGPADSSDIGLRVTVTPGAKIPEWPHYSIHVDGRDIALEQGERYFGEIRLRFVEYTDQWGPAIFDAAPVKLDLSESDRAKLLGSGFDLALDHAVSRAATKVRIVVEDAVSGAAGSVTIPVKR